MPSKRPAPSQSSGPSRRTRRSTSEESDAPNAATQPASQGVSSGRAGLSITASFKQINHCAAQLVRLALFNEYQRKPFRRAYIIEKVIPPNAKAAFNIVLGRAQTVLRTNFGMELFELRAKSKGVGMEETQMQTQQTQQTQAQTRRKKGRTSRLDAIEEEEEEDEEEDEDEDGNDEATQAASQAVKPPGSKTYIVRSTLSPEIREMMAQPLPLTMTLEAGERQENDYIDSGAMIPWEKADGTSAGSVQLLGIRTVILCLVLCHGRVIADDTLHALLKRVNLYRDTLLPYSSPDGKETHMTLDKYIDLLARQQYLEKVKIQGQLGVGDTAMYEWRWGNREAEFSEKAVQEWMTRILMGEEEEDNDDEDTRDRRVIERRRQRKKDRAAKEEGIRNDVVKAAGGPLTGTL